MTGKTFIDGQDIWTAYGAFVTEGGYAGLVQFPSLKAIEYNDWPEENGIEPDLSAPVLDSKNLSISFAFVGQNSDAMIQALSDKGYHTFLFNEVGRSFRLRLVSAGPLTVADSLRLQSFTFADDFPLDGYSYQSPAGAGLKDSGYGIDGTDLSDYGIRILQGTVAEIDKIPSVKSALSRNVAAIPGIIYDGDGKPVFQSKDVSLSCLMRADSLSDFWRNHDALLYDITRAGEHVLYWEDIDWEYSCFYKDMSVNEFIPTGRVWMKFSLTLTFIAPEAYLERLLLSTEDNYYVITEDGYLVDMKEYD